MAIIVEDFHFGAIAHQITGKAKAMIVTRSRLHAALRNLTIVKNLEHFYSVHYLTASWSDRISGRIETWFLNQYFDWDAKMIARIPVS